LAVQDISVVYLSWSLYAEQRKAKVREAEADAKEAERIVSSATLPALGTLMPRITRSVVFKKEPETSSSSLGRGVLLPCVLF
jgi:hypothetical protein